MRAMRIIGGVGILRSGTSPSDGASSSGKNTYVPREASNDHRNERLGQFAGDSMA